MAKNYAPATLEYEGVARPPETSAQDNIDNIIILDEYRKERIRQDILQNMALSALQLCGGNNLDCKAIYTSEDAEGNILTHFATYSQGYTGDTYGTPHSGWSGSETYGIITVTYDSTSSHLDAHKLHPRNIRFVQSDIRGQERDRQNYETAHRK